MTAKLRKKFWDQATRNEQAVCMKLILVAHHCGDEEMVKALQEQLKNTGIHVRFSKTCRKMTEKQA